jgi:hypothetical protein
MTFAVGERVALRVDHGTLISGQIGFVIGHQGQLQIVEFSEGDSVPIPPSKLVRVRPLTPLRRDR